MLLIKNHYIWIPIEATLIGEKEKFFCDAWKNATEQLKFRECNIIDVHDAWKKYRPLPVKALDHIIESDKVSLPSQSPVPGFLRQHQSIQTNRKKYLEQLESKVRQYPDSVQLVLKLGNIYAMLDSSELAITHYKSALLSEPTNFSSYNNLANVYFKQGILDSAEINYHKAIAYASTVDDSDGIYLNLATLCAAVDSLELASQMYAKVIKSPDDIPRVDSLLGISLGKIDLSEIKKLPTEISAVIIKQIVQQALARAGKTQIPRYSDKIHITYGLKKSKKQIRDVFYWSF